MTEPKILRDEALTGRDEVGGLVVDWAVVCHVGRVREANEDAALALPGRYIVADGMGGHDSGELASEAALLTLAEAEIGDGPEATRARVGELLIQAQDRIGELGSETGRRAGTTATGVVLAAEDETPQWVAFNIGDSRTYLFTAGELRQVSVDHSQVQELVAAGFLTPAEARVDSRRNVITRALGAGMAVPVADYFSFPAKPGDTILLCSDGLDGELTDDEIAVILEASPDNQIAAAALVEAALESGAHDNVTVTVLSVVAESAAEGPEAAAAEELEA
ncbi:protein phosphatase 2C domain-containing protein [Gordonia sp. (in: high G+C Gram-positive bacteria)]|mgnify:CR=1 FL=1|uniref:PP2C family protein-serine/threonine phosphatase n=1 Tax=Gordonia sp. (in: high G+C Gram-positive bacteria) TaxID=84139 RepID=UPI0016988191|nr:protein phosphatase 2C domain-containing protein [Gordonia sp. (in: high G+C Gram-positive bacteria)]NLG47511.1 serine/threonine-protein phosphatase [Gordonia sp. (in: high G+C Gram-positive bacteria)]